MNLWEQILARIETKLNRHSYYTWFKPTSFVAEDRTTVTVRVPNALFKDWLTKHYSGLIGEAMHEIKKGGLFPFDTFDLFTNSRTAHQFANDLVMRSHVSLPSFVFRRSRLPSGESSVSS